MPRPRLGRASQRPANRRPRPASAVTPPQRNSRRRRNAAPVDPVVARARLLLLGLFTLSGLIFSSWLARIPAVRTMVGMSESELGAILIAGSVGSLATVSLAGMLVTRYGGRLVLHLSTAAFAAAYLLIGLGPTLGSVPLLACGIFLSGCSFALGNVPLNVETAAVERRLGRTVLPQFHAAFSIGSVAGSLVGAMAAHFQVPLIVQFSVTALIGVIWRTASVPGAVLDSLPPDPAHRERARREKTERAESRRQRGDVTQAPRGLRTRARPGSALDAWREPRTLLIGVVIMSAALSEGSANDWLALAVVDDFEQTETVGAVMFGVFVAAMTTVRLLGTWLIDRYGRVFVLRASGVVSLSGLLLFGLSPSLPVAAVGIMAWGFGAALAVPIGIAAASDDPLRAAPRVSVVSAFSSTASLAAPPLLGIAAEAIGAQHALLLITVAMVVSVLLAQVVRRPASESASASHCVPGPTAIETAIEAEITAGTPATGVATGQGASRADVHRRDWDLGRDGTVTRPQPAATRHKNVGR